MAKSLMVEEESGVITRTRHQHNGYYAGDFTEVPFRELLMTTFQRPRSGSDSWWRTETTVTG
jgi:hypothetical protein